MDTLTARMPNPAVIIPEAMKPIPSVISQPQGAAGIAGGFCVTRNSHATLARWSW